MLHCFKRVSLFAKWVSGRIDISRLETKHVDALFGSSGSKPKTAAPTNKSLNANRSSPAAPRVNQFSEETRRKRSAWDSVGGSQGLVDKAEWTWDRAEGVLLAEGFFGLSHTQRAFDLVKHKVWLPGDRIVVEGKF
jgi:hypothetical protein